MLGVGNATVDKNHELTGDGLGRVLAGRVGEMRTGEALLLLLVDPLVKHGGNLRLRVSEVLRVALELLVLVVGELVDVGDDQIVLRAEQRIRGGLGYVGLASRFVTLANCPTDLSPNPSLSLVRACTLRGQLNVICFIGVPVAVLSAWFYNCDQVHKKFGATSMLLRPCLCVFSSFSLLSVPPQYGIYLFDILMSYMTVTYARQ